MNEQFRSAMAMLGIGSYTVEEAGRLVKTPARNVRRWMGGYTYRDRGQARSMPPLWSPQLPQREGHVEIGFRDLIELRFVKAFIDAGVGLKAIRSCLDYARELVREEHPLATRRFRTDGRTIFLDSLEQSNDPTLLDLKRRQFAFKQIIDRTFRDLDIDGEIVARWRPYRGKDTIVIDPARAFGQPIAAASGVPTVALAEAAEAEGSIEHAAALFDVPIDVVRDAVHFELSLRPS
jgi:uncharacterized protein (DUF433 family)